MQYEGDYVNGIHQWWKKEKIKSIKSKGGDTGDVIDFFIFKSDKLVVLECKVERYVEDEGI